MTQQTVRGCPDRTDLSERGLFSGICLSEAPDGTGSGLTDSLSISHLASCRLSKRSRCNAGVWSFPACASCTTNCANISSSFHLQWTHFNVATYRQRKNRTVATILTLVPPAGGWCYSILQFSSFSSVVFFECVGFACNTCTTCDLN